MTAQRETAERSWCTGEHIISHTLPLHQSQVKKVGPQPEHTGDGVASFWLQAGKDGPTRVGLGVAHMARAGITMSLEDARLFIREFTRMLALAEQD